MSKEMTFDLNKLITKKEMIEKVEKGEKTAVRRSNRFGDIGDTFTVSGKEYELVNVYQQQLGDVTEENAKQEGFDSLDAYKESITSIHSSAVWVPKLKVWVHEFASR